MAINFSKIIYVFLASAVVGVGVSYSKVYLFHVTLLLMTCSFIYIKKSCFKFKVVELPTRRHYIFYLMFIWYFISLLWSWNAFYTLQYLSYIFFGLSIVLTVIYYSSDLQKQRCLYLVLSSVFITEIILCLMEGLTPFRWPISPFSPYVTYFGRNMGIDDDLSVDVLAMVLRGPTGFQWNTNNLCTIMNLICPFFLFINSKYLRLIGPLSIFLIILLAASRTNLMAFLIMMLLYGFCYSRTRAVKSLMWLVPIVLAAVFSFTTLKMYAEEDAKFGRLFHMLDAATVYVSGEITGDDSVSVRQQLIKNGIHALMGTYGLGVGGGASKTVQEIVGVSHETTSMHNFWVELLVEGGVVFAALFYSWYVATIYTLYQIYLKAGDKTLKYFAASCSLSLVIFIIGAISCSSVIYDLPVWILFGFSIATINNYKRNLRKSVSIASGYCKEYDITVHNHRLFSAELK